MITTEDIEAALPGAVVVRMTPLHGGDLSVVMRADLRDGTRVVAKHGPRVATEARMLRAMAVAGADTPEVLGQSGSTMVMSWLEPGTADAAAWSRCGESLRRVHEQPGTGYGWPESYAFGPVAILNAATESWPTFWGARRLSPCAPALPAAMRQRLEAVIARLRDLLPHDPAPALLHGDLWSGNIHFTNGTGALIDPACYHGHGEVDLAMLDLFGGLPDPFLQGYGPLEPDAAQRRAIYQLWPALVHLRLFGSGYLGMVSRLLDRID